MQFRSRFLTQVGKYGMGPSVGRCDSEIGDKRAVATGSACGGNRSRSFCGIPRRSGLG